MRIRRLWTGVWEEGYTGDGALRGQALGLNRGLKSVVRGAQEGGCLCCIIFSRVIFSSKNHFLIRKLGFTLLDLPLLCKPFKRVYLVKSSALEEVRRSNAFWGIGT